MAICTKEGGTSYSQAASVYLSLGFAMMVGKIISDDEVIASTDDSNNPIETEDKECSEADNEDAP